MSYDLRVEMPEGPLQTGFFPDSRVIMFGEDGHFDPVPAIERANQMLSPELAIPPEAYAGGIPKPVTLGHVAKIYALGEAMKEDGLRPLTAQEIMAFAAQHPHTEYSPYSHNLGLVLPVHESSGSESTRNFRQALYGALLDAGHELDQTYFITGVEPNTEGDGSEITFDEAHPIDELERILAPDMRGGGVISFKIDPTKLAAVDVCTWASDKIDIRVSSQEVDAYHRGVLVTRR